MLSKHKIYQLAGCAGVIGTSGGSLLLAMSADYISFSFAFWLMGVLGFSTQFAMIRVKGVMYLEYLYLAINTVAVNNYTGSFSLALFYACLGLLIVALSQHILASTHWQYIMPKQQVDPQRPLPAVISEKIGVSLSVVGAVLMATQLTSLYVVFTIWLLASLAFVVMSILIDTHHFSLNAMLFIIADTVGIYTHGEQYFALTITTFIVLAFFSVLAAIRFNINRYGSAVGVKQT